QIVVAYSIFQNGCLAGSRHKKRQLAISAARRQRERRPSDLRLHHESKCPLFPQKRTLPGGGLRPDPPRPGSVADPPQIVQVAFMSSNPLLLHGEGQHGVESWLERKRTRRRNKRPRKLQACASYWGDALTTFRFRGVTDLAKRLN